MTHIRYLFFFLLFLFIQTANAQSKQHSVLDSLSAEDLKLLEEYQDSFKTELQDVLSVFDSYKRGKFDTTVADMNRRSHVETGLDFTSRILSNGRESGLNGVGFFPSAAYIHKYGFYAALAMAFFTDATIAKAAPVPVVVPTIGFQRMFFKRWTIGVAYSRTFINYGSDVSRQLLNNNFSFATGIDMWKRFTLSTNLLADWSSYKPPRILSAKIPPFMKRSFEINLTLRKDFIIYKFIGAKVFTVSPAFSVCFATDNLAFVREKTAAEQKKNPLGKFTVGIDNFFGLVNLESSLLLDWRIRNLEICVAPALAIPFNEFDYNSNSRVLNPHAYRFYMQAGVKYLFCIKKKTKKV